MLYGYLTINVAALCIVYFTFTQWIVTVLCKMISSTTTWANRIIQDLSRKSFGIYLVHILIMRELVWPMWLKHDLSGNYAIQIPTVAILSYILSYVTIKSLSLIPHIRHII